MCYGFFFYPLYTLGIGQMFRVLDAALKRYCEQIGPPPKPINKFHDRINWLQRTGVFSEFQSAKWHNLRQLRNLTSHTDSQEIMPLSWAHGILMDAQELINDLFDGTG